MPADPYFDRLLREIQENGFALVDLQLHLDTHPTDSASLAQYEARAGRERVLARAFEERYGPLHNYGESASADINAWINGPWPWEL